MADSTRLSSFLPTVKCSMCAGDIEISMMGEHVCSKAPAMPTLPEPSPRLAAPGFGNNQRLNSPNFLKPGRIAPPQVDVSAANRPFFRQESLTPVSASSESRNASPMTPSYEGRKSPFSGAPRAAKGAVRRPPSPEILSNNDSAFPLFPPPKSPYRGGKESTGRTERPELPRQIEADAHPPMSPRDASVGGVLKRMNTIAPGPFDMNGRRGQTERIPEEQAGGYNASDIPRPATSSEVRGHKPRPSLGGLGHSRSLSKGGQAMDRPTNQQQERPGGYGGFGPPPPEIPRLRQEDRSQTFPVRQSSAGASLPRRPSEPGTGRERQQAGAADIHPPMPTAPAVSPPRQRRPSTANSDRSKPPPRGNSLIQRERNGTSMSDKINLAEEFGIGNPYHTPSTSQSSNGSSQSAHSQSSSRSSPPGSTRPPNPRQQPSSSAGLSTVMSNLQLKMREDSDSDSARNEDQYARPTAPPRSLQPSLLSPESPMDPAIQGGRLSPLPGRNDPAGPFNPQRRQTSSKGNCKGCGEGIKGKSVSSADGRLTGRYHKHCFVCKTCSEPFATATFYVINDAPYCARHYHQLNDSLCHSCDKGIEGQYLETERKQKYHPYCLTCSDCKRVLRDDYFEMNGLVYCERDAFRKAQQRTFLGPGAGGTNRMERRTTRLMMMAGQF